MKEKQETHALKVSISVLSQLVRYLNYLKLDVDRLFRSLGIDPSILKSPDEQIALESYIAIENEAARISGDPCFGLHMGELFEPGNYSIVGYLMMNSRTLGEAFEKAGRYYRIIGNLITPVVQIGFKKLKIFLTAPRHAPRFSRHCFEAAFSSQVTMMRKITGRQIDPLEAGFSSQAPASIAEYERVFRCPVRFGLKHDYITLDMRIGGIPVLQPNPALLAYFESYAKELLAGLEGTEKTTMEVTRIILNRLSGRRLGIRSVAKEMSMSVRTLQNRLKDEDMVFSKLLEDTRARMAKRYLRENYTVEDIACLLGFSDSSVFRKAFKKWSGRTPKEYRETMVRGETA